jgi:hypothetical protein
MSFSGFQIPIPSNVISPKWKITCHASFYINHSLHFGTSAFNVLKCQKCESLVVVNPSRVSALLTPVLPLSDDYPME